MEKETERQVRLKRGRYIITKGVIGDTVTASRFGSMKGSSVVAGLCKFRRCWIDIYTTERVSI